MSDFVSGAQAYSVDTLPWLNEHRVAAERLWQTASMPNRKTEDWKYTSLKSFANTNFFASSNSGKDISTLVSASTIDGITATKLVFVDGVFDSELSTSLDDSGADVVPFSLANEHQQNTISTLLNSCVDLEKHQFAALNTKNIEEGVLIDLPVNTLVQNPIHIVHLATSSASATASNARLIVNAGKSSSATVIEHYFGEGDTETQFNNSVTELIVGENAQLSFYRLMDEAEKVNHISGVHVRLARSARLTSFFLALGTELTRVDVNAIFEGEGAEAEINGVYLPKNKQHVDIHTCMEHAVPHCESNETFRGIISDQARAVFNGRIHIHRDAQKTEAYLSNKNLLTSNKAEVDTKPELEIYADDVRCAHGATIAQLEENSMHYLKTRGISEDEARVMLSFGFINELLGQIKLEALADYCRPKLAARFAREEHLTRHLQ